MLSDEQIQEIRDGCRTDWHFNLNEFARKIESAARSEALNDAVKVCDKWVGCEGIAAGIRKLKELDE